MPRPYHHWPSVAASISAVVRHRGGLQASGKTSEAIDRLKRAIESPAATVPKDALLFALAGVYEASGASSDARATYQRIVSDYPNSPYRPDAREKLPNG